MIMSAIARLIIYKLFIVRSFGLDTNDFIMIKLPITVSKLFGVLKSKCLDRSDLTGNLGGVFDGRIFNTRNF